MNVIALLLLTWFGIMSGVADPVGDEATPGVAPSAAPEPDAPPAAFPESAGVPRGDIEIEQRFLSRSPVPGCGRVGRIDDKPQGPGVAYDWRCLEDAGDDGAEALVILATDADEPVYTYYRLNPGGPMEIFVDRRADSSAESEWAYRQCEPGPELRNRPCQD